jgi:hypothetical protein
VRKRTTGEEWQVWGGGGLPHKAVSVAQAHLPLALVRGAVALREEILYIHQTK